MIHHSIGKVIECLVRVECHATTLPMRCVYHRDQAITRVGSC